MRLGLVLMIAASSFAPGSATARCPTALDRTALMDEAFRSYVFGRVWETVNDAYIYTEFGGVNWASEEARFRQTVLAAPSNEAFYLEIDNMILALNDDHSVYLSPWDSCAEDNYSDGTEDELTAYTDYLPSVNRHAAHPGLMLIDLPSFDSFEVPDVLESELRASFREGAVDAVVIDLRHNYGGYLEAAYDVLGQFVTGKLGVQFDKNGDHTVSQRRGLYYNRLAGVPLVILVDNETHSAAEIVAGVLQAERGATVVGVTPSAGNTEMLLPFDYIDGSRLWLAIGGFKLRDGTDMEGRGVVPDVVVAAGSDSELLGALEHFGLSAHTEALAD